ncbi:MAG: Nif11-like leader peptide family natural product precursor [Dolichospermum sp.]|nr:Nif11-like leader peptide family natural product precursor [Dolichospermum sp.]
MSIEAVRQFNQIAEDDPEIKKSLEAATDSEGLINLAVELGSQRDFIFTAKEVETYYQESTNTKRAIWTASRSFASFNMESGNNANPSPCSGLPYLARQICLKLNQ